MKQDEKKLFLPESSQKTASLSNTKEAKLVKQNFTDTIEEMHQNFKIISSGKTNGSYNLEEIMKYRIYKKGIEDSITAKAVYKDNPKAFVEAVNKRIIDDFKTAEKAAAPKGKTPNSILQSVFKKHPKIYKKK